MKKILLVTALISISLSMGCKKADTQSAPASSPTAAATPKTQFSDASVNDYIKTYSDYADQYIAALAAAKKGDTSKMMSLSSKAQEMATQQQQLATKLKPEEATAFAAAVNAISQRIQAAATK